VFTRTLWVAIPRKLNVWNDENGDSIPY
jgi:hypothetical protein